MQLFAVLGRGNARVLVLRLDEDDDGSLQVLQQAGAQLENLPFLVVLSAADETESLTLSCRSLHRRGLLVIERCGPDEPEGVASPAVEPIPEALRRARHCVRLGARHASRRQYEALLERVELQEADRSAVLCELGRLLAAIDIEGCREVLEKARESVTGGADYVHVHRQLAAALAFANQREESRRMLALAEQEAERLGEPELQGDIAGSWGGYYHYDDFEKAEDGYRRSIELFRSCGAEGSEVNSLQNLGTLLARLGRGEEARRCLEEAVQARRRLGSTDQLARALLFLADLHGTEGRRQEARGLIEEALRIQRELGTEEDFTAVVLSYLGRVMVDDGEYEKALGTLMESKRILGPDSVMVASCLDMMGNARAGLGELSEAAVLHEGALELNRKWGLRVPEGASLHNLAVVDHRLGRCRIARERLRDALEIARKESSSRLEAHSLMSLGHCLASDDPAVGRAWLRCAIELSEDVSLPEVAVEARIFLADLSRGESVFGDLAREAVSIARNHQLKRLLPRALRLWEESRR